MEDLVAALGLQTVFLQVTLVPLMEVSTEHLLGLRVSSLLLLFLDDLVSQLIVVMLLILFPFLPFTSQCQLERQFCLLSFLALFLFQKRFLNTTTSYDL